MHVRKKAALLIVKKLIRFIFPFICNPHICGLNKSQVNAIHLQNSSYE